MCIVCRIGEGRESSLGGERLNEIAASIRKNPVMPIRLYCNTYTIFRFQNPQHDEDTPGGRLFNEKRDLDILQRMGLVPGDTRPAIDLFARLLDSVPTAEGICGGEQTGREWKGCPRAHSGFYEKGHALGLQAVVPGRTEEEMARTKRESVEEMYRSKELRIRPHHLMCMTCFHGGKSKLAPIKADNLFEAIDIIQKSPDIPVRLIEGCCMICPPCKSYHPATALCIGGQSMGLRDQKKDLDVLRRLGLKYGDLLPARRLYRLLFEKIHSTTEICGYGDGIERSHEWRVCCGPDGSAGYVKAREANLGIEGGS